MTQAIEVVTGSRIHGPGEPMEFYTILWCTEDGLKHLLALAQLALDGGEPQHSETIRGAMHTLQVRRQRSDR